MSARSHPVGEHGDAPCWAHEFGEFGVDPSIEHRTDIEDRTDIASMVRTFYRAAAMDDLLGPVFAAAGVHWDAHIATVTDFWAWQLLGQPGYSGQPLRAHEGAHARTPFTPAMFERWLDLFSETIDELFVGDRAEGAKLRGRKMAAAMARLLGGVSDRGDVPIEPMWRHASAESGAIAAVSSPPARSGGRYTV